VLAVAAAGTAATVALAFAGYLAQAVPVPAAVGACALVALLTAVNVRGVVVSSRLNVAFTLLEVGGLVAFVALAAARGDLARGAGTAPTGSVLAGASLLFFAYLGFEDVASLAGEAKRPRRDLPRAVIASVLVTTVLYVAVGVAALALLDPGRLAASDAPLAAAAEEASPGAARALGVVALFATANTALIALMAGSRMVYGMADRGDLPSALGRVHGRHGSPWVAALLVGAVASAFAALGGVASVARLSSFAALVAFGVVNAAVVVLRLRSPTRARPFRVPLSIGRVPLLPVLGFASGGLLLLQFEGATYLVGGAVVAGALALHGLRAAVSRGRPRR
jgi:amino acid transporter